MSPDAPNLENDTLKVLDSPGKLKLQVKPRFTGRWGNPGHSIGKGINGTPGIRQQHRLTQPGVKKTEPHHNRRQLRKFDGLKQNETAPKKGSRTTWTQDTLSSATGAGR